jgi:hypothetical protein
MEQAKKDVYVIAKQNGLISKAGVLELKAQNNTTLCFHQVCSYYDDDDDYDDDDGGGDSSARILLRVSTVS